MSEKLKAILRRLWYGSGDGRRADSARNIAAVDVEHTSAVAALMNTLERTSAVDLKQAELLRTELFRQWSVANISALLNGLPNLSNSAAREFVWCAVDGHQQAVAKTYFNSTHRDHSDHLRVRDLSAAVIRRMSIDASLDSVLRSFAEIMRSNEAQYNPFSDDSAFQIAQRRSYQLTAELLENILARRLGAIR